MITIDADGQHLAEDLPRFLEAIRDAPDAIVIGCRDFTAPHIPDGSRFGRRFSNFWVRLETGKALDDTQSGFRAYPVAWIQRLPLVSMRYDFEIEALVRALWAGLPVREVPVQVIYPPPGERVSHFHPFRDNARLSRLHARLVGRSLAPWPHRRLIARPPEESLLALLRHPARTMRWFLAENVTAEGLAAAAAVGSFLGVLPLISCHTAVILFAATRLHVNRALALAIQNLYMPPFTPFLCIQLGHYFRYGEWWTVFTRETLVENVHQRLYEWLLGSLVLAPIFAVLAGLITYLIARGVRRWPRRGTA